MNVIHEARHDIPIVSTAISFRSGMVHEPEGKGGLARIVGRMLRRGAGAFDAQHIERAFGALGANLGVSVTSEDMMVSVLGLKRTLAPTAGLLSMILSRPTFDPEELGRLLRETEGDLLSYVENDGYLAHRAFSSALYGIHPYARSSQGTIESMRAISREDVLAFYGAHFTRANAVATVSGDIDSAEARKLAEGLVSGLPEGVLSSRNMASPSRRSGRHLVIVDKPERVQCQVMIGCLGSKVDDPHYFPLLVASAAFGGTFTSRMMKRVREERGWSYSAGARLDVARVRAGFVMDTAPASADVANCVGLELGMLEELCERGVAADELQHAKNYLVRTFAFDQETAAQRVGLRHAALCLGIEGFYDRYVAGIEAVTEEQVREAVKTRLSAHDVVIAVVGTASEIANKVTCAIPNVSTVTVTPFDKVR